MAPPTVFRVAPDGRSVAYVEELGGARQVCLGPLRGGPRIQLTASATDVTDVEWSPDGTRLAYVCDTAIWVIDADGGHPVKVTDHPWGNETPRWAPDGERLAFISRRRGVLEIGPTGRRAYLERRYRRRRLAAGTPALS